MTTSLALATKLDILKETRELFANTHWTSGVLYQTLANGKKQFCMVGGICHVFAKNNLPEWLQHEKQQSEGNEFKAARHSFYMQEIEDDSFLKNIDAERFLTGMDAEWELAKTIKALDNEVLAEDASPAQIEDIIVNWNDGPADDEFQKRGNASYVLEVMDITIARVESEENAD